MSEKEQQDEQQRVSKREFIAKISSRSRIPVKTVNRVYDTALAELMEIVTRGDQLMLTGFGKFYPQAHKGHRVQFAEGGETEIDDYFVLKFSATRSVNKAIAQGPVESEPESSTEDNDSMSWQDEDGDDELSDADRYGPEDPAEQDALFDDPKSKAKAKAKTKAAASRRAPKVSASLAAAATQSARSTKRVKRQIVEGPSDKAI